MEFCTIFRASKFVPFKIQIFYGEQRSYNFTSGKKIPVFFGEKDYIEKKNSYILMLFTENKFNHKHSSFLF